MRYIFPCAVLCISVFFTACASSGGLSSAEISSSSEAVAGSSSSVSAAARVVTWNSAQGFVGPDGNALALRGAAFGNEVWSSDNPSPYHHTEVDFERLRSMGLNAIRFYMSYKFFEADSAPFVYKQTGWDWLDTNLAWAGRHGVYLFLNFHVPQGGYQSNGGGAALWDDVSNQDRLTALWYNVAKRCAGNPNVAGYDLVNEPVVTQGKAQWQALAQRLIDTIRTVDTEHLIFVERVNGIIGGSYANDSEMNFVTFKDPYGRTGLTFHFYGPIEFTHQYASWTSFAKEDGGSYPDTTILQLGDVTWKTATHSNPSVPEGTTDWIYYTGKWFAVTDTSETNVAQPTLVCKNVNDGTVYFDSLKVEELSPAGDSAVIAEYNLPSAGNWYFWTQETGGSVVTSDTASVGITGTVSDANYADSKMQFLVHEGYQYRASGKMKGVNVPATAGCLVRLDLKHAATVTRRDKAYLAGEIGKYAAVAKARNLPMYVGEFGAISYTMTQEKGGLRWASDMMDIFDSLGIAFTYHDWHEDNFGIYRGAGGRPIDPSNANQGLIDLFTQRYYK